MNNCCGQIVNLPDRYPGQRLLTVNNGLPQGQVRGMVQDKQGFIWLATNGLSRYDGHSFLNYRHQLNDPFSLADDDIRDLQIDDQDNLWIVYVTNKVDVLNATTGRLRHLSAEPAFRWLEHWTFKGIHFTIRQAGNRYFAAIGNKMVAFDMESGIPQPVKNLPEGEMLVASGNTIDGKSLMATTQGIYELHHNQLQLYYRFPALQDSIYKIWYHALDLRKIIGKIVTDKCGKWIIPAVGGIYTFDPQQKTAVYTGNPLSLRLPVTLERAINGDIYFSLESGIYKTNCNSLPELVYSNNNQKELYKTLLADRSGMIWASADIHGISLFNVHAENFHSAAYTTNFVNDVLQKWLSGPPGFKSYGPYELRSGKDTAGNIWLLNERTQWQNGQSEIKQTELSRLHAFGMTRYKLPDAAAQPLFFTFDGFNRCWLVLVNKESKRTLAKADLKSGTMVPYTRLPDGWKDNGYLTSIAGYIGYLPEDELRLYDTATAVCRVFSREAMGISGLLLMAVPDRQDKNILWIATKGSGIVKLNILTGKTKHFTAADGLPNNTVYYIAPDKNGLFWCSSNTGLFRFNPVSGDVASFTVKDGLQGNEFNRYHFLETPDGHFYFGGTEGYTVFHPDSVSLDTYQTPVAITSVEVNNMPLQQMLAPLKHRLISSIDAITLNYDQNFLTFSFAGLQYNAPEKLQYRYQLQGIDKGWVNTGYDANARYAALPPGHYIFRVNATNTSGVWSRLVKSLKITILPPWWRTWWACIIYIAALLGGIYALYRNWLRQEQARQQIILKEKEAAQALALEEIRNRFFANITHELRTPLTLIISPLQKQLQESDKACPPALLEGIHRNSQILLRLINQLLDISKLEAGSMKLILSQGNLVAFMEYILNAFHQQAAAKSINMTYVHTAPSEEYLFDSDKLEKIIYNLVGNALKFTPAGGRVVIRLQCRAINDDDHQIWISVSDTGIGIAATHLPYVFDRFYQINAGSTRRFEGTGIGLSLVKELTELMNGSVTAESTEGKGSVFTLTLVLKVAKAQTAVPEVTYPVIADITTQDILVDVAGDVAAPDVSRPLVLVTEDNEQLRTFISASLATHFQVITAPDGHSGWEAACSELPDLIISDVMMPVMDGYEFCHKIKENPVTSHIGFIMLTAKTAGESRITGLRQGADHYLGKPFMVEELVLTVSNLLKRQTKLREHYSRQLLVPAEKLPATDEVEDEFLRAAYVVIEDHLDSDKLDVEFLAGKLAVSRRTLNRKLAAIAGTSANELIRNYRLKKAAELLLQGDAVSSAAYATGFSTPSWFTRCFKELYGITPVQYAENEGLAQQ